MPWVGSWASQKRLNSDPNDTTFGSYTTSTASVWPVRPEQTSSYEGFLVVPPAYPTAVAATPSVSQNSRSAPPETAHSEQDGLQALGKRRCDCGAGDEVPSADLDRRFPIRKGAVASGLMGIA